MENHHSQETTLLNPRQTAEFLDIEIGTLSVWRATKRYPLRYVKIGASVKYRLSDLEAFIESRIQNGGGAAL